MTFCDNPMHCRQRRQIFDKDSQAFATKQIVFETPVPLFAGEAEPSYQDENGNHKMVAKLVPSHFPLIGPNYKLVIRDEDEEKGTSRTNTTIPKLPNCLFRGTLLHDPNIRVALSTCGGQEKIVSIMSRFKLTYHMKYLILFIFRVESLSLQPKNT